jgi:hypothetical protein
MCRLVCVALLVAHVVGCGKAVQYNDDIDARTIDNGEEISVDVLAKASSWKQSGVNVVKGVKYHVVARGRWTAHASFCGWTDASGEGIKISVFCHDHLSRPVSGYSYSTLIAKIGEDGVPFPVGRERAFVANKSGPLLYRMNDNDAWFGDNTGYVTVVTRLHKEGKETVRDEWKKNSSQAVQQKKQIESVPMSPANVERNSVGVRWALIIGISMYKDTRIPSLRYASRDAQSFYDWIVSPQGGAYAPSRVMFLQDNEATAAAIKDALFNWLGEALEEDVVTVYFAGHGSPQSPDDSDNLFLLPYDVDYERISSTAFPMWDIETALKRFIKARRVVVIADACHSGGVGQSFDVALRSNRGVKVNGISNGLQNLTAVGEGVAVISASDANQFSKESQEWGGGHGVFTYFLLQGLRGEADYNKDSHVTLGELIPYLSEQVRRATKNSQSPTIAGKFDPALSLGR